MTAEIDLGVVLPGGAGRPDLKLKNPLLAASGTFGYGREYADYFDPALLGGLVTKGLSLEPREGNPPPRICETAGGMLNSIGLANPGLERFLAEELPHLAGLDTCVVVNLYAEDEDDFAELARRLDGVQEINALEINLSCPNVSGGGMAFGVDPEAVRRLTRVVRQQTEKPLWVKLTPNVSDPRPMAAAAQAAGADAVSLINTLLGMAIDAHSRRPRLGNIFGGLSGPAIKPVGLRMVYQVAREVDLPVIGMGGITSGQDVVEYLLAGAGAVQVGTAGLADPAAWPRILAELEDFCRQEGVARVAELVGALEAGRS